MIITYKEYSDINYSLYQFPYCIYATKELNDNLSDIYAKGFLAYTNDLTENQSIFYLARSIRVNLSEHQNRVRQNNINNKMRKIFPDDDITFTIKNKTQLVKDQSFIDWCLDFSTQRFSNPLSLERLNYILNRNYLQEILEIKFQEKVLAYIFLPNECNTFSHVWYSFYSLEYISINDFGKWILLKAVEWSKKQNFQYIYLGTCYSNAALYKLSLSDSTEFFNGSQWDSNISELKKKLINDSFVSNPI